jgi:hypothetical protein
MDPNDKVKISLASSNYYVKENRNYNTYMMMSSIDDIPKICNNVICSYKWAKLIIKLIKHETKDDHELEILDTMSKGLENKNTTLHFIHYNDDLMKLYLDLKDAGYDAGITYQCGRITDIYTRFKCSYRKKEYIININIRCQELIKSAIFGEMYISNEQTYNNMHRAMTDFNNKLFKIEHKSYYTKLEIDILDEYRSFANVGMTKEGQNVKGGSFTEIDITKRQIRHCKKIFACKYLLQMTYLSLGDINFCKRSTF